MERPNNILCIHHQSTREIIVVILKHFKINLIYVQQNLHNSTIHTTYTHEHNLKLISEVNRISHHAHIDFIGRETII